MGGGEVAGGADLIKHTHQQGPHPSVEKELIGWQNLRQCCEASKDTVPSHRVILSAHANQRYKQRRHPTILEQPAHARVVFGNLRKKLRQLLCRAYSPTQRAISLKLAQAGLKGPKECTST